MLRKLPIAAASLAVELALSASGFQDWHRAGSAAGAQGHWDAGSVAGRTRLTAPRAYGIFPDQRSDPCHLHWRADSSPLDHQGSPSPVVFFHQYNSDFSFLGCVFSLVFPSLLEKYRRTNMNKQFRNQKASLRLYFISRCYCFIIYLDYKPFMEKQKEFSIYKLNFYLNVQHISMKVTQLCLTLCDPINYTVHGILQARILEWVPFPFPRDLPNPGITPISPALQADSLPAEPQEKPKNTGVGSLSLLQQLFPGSPVLQADSLSTELREALYLSATNVIMFQIIWKNLGKMIKSSPYIQEAQWTKR